MQGEKEQQGERKEERNKEIGRLFFTCTSAGAYDTEKKGKDKHAEGWLLITTEVVLLQYVRN